MTKTMVITGVDGCGKSTAIDYYKSFEQMDKYYPINAPQFFEDKSLPFYKETLLLEKIAKMADKQKDYSLKASATFCAMAYMGDIIKYIKETHSPKLIITERHSLVDSIAYAKFYLNFITNEKVDISNYLNYDDLGVIDCINNRIKNMWDDSTLNLGNIHIKLKSVFLKEKGTLVSSLEEFFKLDIPDYMLMLSVSEDTFRKRMPKDGQEKELHEESKILLMMQEMLKSTCQSYFAQHPQMHFMDNSNIAVDDFLSKVQRIHGL
jgi:thymidylate kinase